MSLTTAIILNVALDALVSIAILRVLVWGISADMRDQTRRQLERELPEDERFWHPSQPERQAA
jgi:hypothetical protein